MNKFEAVIILEPNTEETIIHEVLKIIEDTVLEIERIFRITEEVMKFIVVRKDD